MEKSTLELEGYEEMRIAGTRVFLPPSDPIPDEPFVGRDDLIGKALAAWSEVDGTSPLHFRLYGPPGTGKNALVYELARILQKDLYIINGNGELDVEDIACTPVIDRENTGIITYVGSPLFAAMVRGGIAFFDEIAKAPHGTLAALASVLDRRGTLTSVTAAIRIKAAPGFLFCAALNEDEEKSTGLPDYIGERTLPAIRVGPPVFEDLMQILESQMSADSDLWLEGFAELFRQVGLSPRSAVKLITTAVKSYRYTHKAVTSAPVDRTAVLDHLRKSAADYNINLHEKSRPAGREPSSKRGEALGNVYHSLFTNRRGTIQ
jgi:MoxR-like ATPase